MCGARHISAHRTTFALVNGRSKSPTKSRLALSSGLFTNAMVSPNPPAQYNLNQEKIGFHLQDGHHGLRRCLALINILGRVHCWQGDFTSATSFALRSPREAPSRCQLIEQRFGLFQIGRVEPFSEPVIELERGERWLRCACLGRAKIGHDLWPHAIPKTWHPVAGRHRELDQNKPPPPTRSRRASSSVQARSRCNSASQTGWSCNCISSIVSSRSCNASSNRPASPQISACMSK